MHLHLQVAMVTRHSTLRKNKKKVIFFVTPLQTENVNREKPNVEQNEKLLDGNCFLKKQTVLKAFIHSS